MALFNEEQLKELEVVFGIKRLPDVLPIRDGFVRKDSGAKIWYRHIEGPRLVSPSEVWTLIENNPQSYQYAKPRAAVTYQE